MLLLLLIGSRSCIMYCNDYNLNKVISVFFSVIDFENLIQPSGITGAIASNAISFFNIYSHFIATFHVHNSIFIVFLMTQISTVHFTEKWVCAHIFMAKGTKCEVLFLYRIYCFIHARFIFFQWKKILR